MVTFALLPNGSAQLPVILAGMYLPVSGGSGIWLSPTRRQYFALVGNTYMMAFNLRSFQDGLHHHKTMRQS